MKVPFDPAVAFEQFRQRLRISADDFLRLKRLQDERKAAAIGAETAGSQIATSQKALTDLAGKEAQAYDEFCQAVHKLPVKERVTDTEAGITALIGVLGNVAGQDGGQLARTALGGIKGRKEDAYQAGLADIKMRQDEDAKKLASTLGGLQARQRAEGTNLDVALGNRAYEAGRADVAAGRAERAQENIVRNAQWQAAFDEDVRRFGLSHALAARADERSQEAHDLNVKLAKDPLAFLDEQVQRHKGLFGGDEAKTRQAFAGDLFIKQAQAEWLPKTLAQEYGLNETQAKILTEQYDQLRTKGRYLEKEILSGLASEAASRANAYSAIEDRDRRWEAAKSTGDIAAMLEIGEQNTNDYNTVVESAKGSLDSLKGRRADLERQFKTGAVDTDGNPLVKDKADYDKRAKALDVLIKGAEAEWTEARRRRDEYIKSGK